MSSKSSSSVYANIREANYGQSKADMLSKFEIALKECSETEDWLQLLFNEEVKRFCRHFDTIEFPIFHREYEYKKILYKKSPNYR